MNKTSEINKITKTDRVNRQITQIVFTLAGIILSFIIAVGGWMLTSAMIGARSDALLSISETVRITAQEIPDAYGDEADGRLYLSENEIVAVLRNMTSRGRWTPHEPMAGQINMEQAITLGLAGLAGYAEVLPAEAFAFNTINANLRQNLQDGNQFLEPVYSFWTVTFTGEMMSATLTMHAATGQIWGVDIIPLYMYTLNANSLISALHIFMSGIGLIAEGNDTAAVTDISPRGYIMASQSFAGGEGYAVATAHGRPTEDGALFLRSLNISLVEMFESEPGIPRFYIPNRAWN